jgi:hypothetical protein
MPRRKRKMTNPLDPSPHYRCGPMPRTAPDAFKSRDDDMLAALEPFFGHWAVKFLAKVRADNPSVAELSDLLRRYKIAPDDAGAICAVYRENRVTPRPRLVDDRAAPGRRRRWSRVNY